MHNSFIYNVFQLNLLLCKISSLHQAGCLWIHLGTTHCSSPSKTIHHDAKKGKITNSISSVDYQCEYVQQEGLTVKRDKTKSGDRVLTIDDLLAKGGIHCRQPYP
jgi:hypothetical protein